MTLPKAFLVTALLSLAGVIHADKPLEIGIREPDKTINSVEYYSFCTFQALDKRPKATKYFAFESKDSTYSLKFSEPSNYIIKDTYYIKTFGGTPPTVHVEVIAKQFIAFPETIRGSEDKDSPKIFNPMKAITHVYDMKTGKIIFISTPYAYDHEVPLVYDIAKLIQFLPSK
jgi:hypothetical protein